MIVTEKYHIRFDKVRSFSGIEKTGKCGKFYDIMCKVAIKTLGLIQLAVCAQNTNVWNGLLNGRCGFRTQSNIYNGAFCENS